MLGWGSPQSLTRIYRFWGPVGCAGCTGRRGVGDAAATTNFHNHMIYQKSLELPNRTNLIWFCLIAAIAAAPVNLGAASIAAPALRPNVVVILADDLGWNDISLHGSNTPTPNIDRLAATGVQFMNLIVNPVCSPSRAAFYTGREAICSGYGGEVGDRLNIGLDLGLETIAQTFRGSGYRTGLFGKWHNGKPADTFKTDAEAASHPTPMMAGFETFAGFYGGGTDFFNQRQGERKPRNWYVNDRQTEEGEGYSTDLITADAVRFIETNRQRPFFCMVAEAAPHEPFQATDALLKRVPAKIRGNIQLTEEMVREQSRDFERTRKADKNTWEYGGFTEAERRVVYSAMVIGLDDSVGRILDTLKQTGIEKNTVVLFFSDNGAMHFIREGNLPFRGWKHDMYDGAIHVPGMLSFPGGGLVGERKYEPAIRACDLYPTLAELARVPIRNAAKLDGVNLLPAILGKAAPPELEWNGIFVYYGGCRTDRWKLIARAGSNELYDLKKDISESQDVAARYPEIATKLRARHDAWLAEHGANVNYTAPALKNSPLAQPKGDILEVSLKASGGRQKEQMDIPLRRPFLQSHYHLTSADFACEPGDCLVYDMKIESMTSGQAAYISSTRAGATVFDANGPGIDFSGAHVASTKQLPAPVGEWKRYVVGIGNLAAMYHGGVRLVVESNFSGEIRVEFDNIQIVKPDGRVIPLWDGGAAPNTGKSQLKVATRSLSEGVTK